MPFGQGLLTHESMIRDWMKKRFRTILLLSIGWRTLVAHSRTTKVFQTAKRLSIHVIVVRAFFHRSHELLTAFAALTLAEGKVWSCSPIAVSNSFCRLHI